MEKNLEFERKLADAMAAYEAWSEGTGTANLEEFLSIQSYSPKLCAELKAHFDLEKDFQGLFGKPAPTLNREDATLPPDQSPGSGRQRIGRYKLLQKIGEGGMGSVWMAAQQEPVKRKVALKVIKRGMDSEQITARFEAERQALALMDHPNIARVLDGGTTEDGRPFFVMELVQGVPFLKYCDENCLEIEQRLQLFVQVCQAVHHAHQKGIIHRDIKPSNVLIAPFDGKPVPKVIDFGLAKAVNHVVLTEKTLFTEFGQVVGTLQYMSPEQAELNSLDVDIRTDIYSLGVMLYELLTGSTPIEKMRFKQEAFLQIMALIKEVDPPTPSTRIQSSKETATGVSQQRNIDPRKLVQILNGDLDWIAMKAIAKERHLRYESANEFANDINRFLCNEPISARPPSATYKLKKFVSRNKIAFSAAVAIAIAALLGLCSLLYGLQASLRATELAKENEAQAVRYSGELKEATKVANDTTRQLESAIVKVVGQETDGGRKDEGDESVDPQLYSRRSSARLATYLGIYAKSNGNFDLAKNALSFAIEEYETLEADGQMTADSYGAWSLIHDNLGDISWIHGQGKDKAENVRAALSILERKVERFGESNTEVLERARYHLNLSNVEQRKANAEKSLAVLEPLLKSSSEARYLAALNFGNLSELLQGEEKLNAIERAIELVAQDDNRFRLLQFYGRAMVVFAGAGQQGKADKYWEQAVALGQQLIDDNSEAPEKSGNLLAEIRYNRSQVVTDTDSKIKLLKEAIDLLQPGIRKKPDEKSKPRYYMSVLNLGLSQLQVGENIDALLNLTESVNVMESWKKNEFLTAAKFLRLRALSAFEPSRALAESRELKVNSTHPAIVDTCKLARAQLNARAYQVASESEKTELFEATVRELESLSPAAQVDPDTLSLVRNGVDFVEMCKDERIKKLFKLE